MRKRTPCRTSSMRRTQPSPKPKKDRDAANSGKEAAEKALTDYKAQQTQKDTRATKAAATSSC